MDDLRRAMLGQATPAPVNATPAVQDILTADAVMETGILNDPEGESNARLS